MNEDRRRQLRQQLLDKRDALQPEAVKRNSQRICQRLSDVATAEKHVAVYFALGNEVDLSTLITDMYARGIRVYVPIVLAESRMLFAPVGKTTTLTRNRYGILEPQVDIKSYVSATALDIVLVPLVGFDGSCNRMGMGGGYYDRCFDYRQHTTCAPELIGVAFDIQRTDDVFTQHWDVPLDRIVTESNTYTRPVES